MPDLRAMRLMTGSEAVVEAMRQIDPDVVPVYPITPQTPMIEGFSKVVAAGRAHAEIINVESEHSAMSAAAASALAGARTMTATSSQGLALMAEVVYIAASMRAPVVIALGNRALSGPINIHCDHSDSMLVRDSGAIQIFAESAQEVYDLMVMAPRIAEHPDVLLPVFVCQDGFTVTHLAEPVETLADDAVRAFVGEYEIPFPLLDLDRVTTQGPFAMPDFHYERRHELVEAMAAVGGVFDDVAEELEELAGRHLAAVEPYALDDADCVIVLLGSTAGTVKDEIDRLRAAGERVGLLTVRSFRPFPAPLVRSALAGVNIVAVLDRAISPGASPPLFTDVSAALNGSNVALRSYVYGLGGRDLLPADVSAIFAELAFGGRLGTSYVGLRPGEGP
jgi:pyruvate ferredoxin oxidoreductase alpha subunit